ncbi:hypothetical protein BSKO_03736 [Bryopsis sp. KO-2023]|nr:hypothetical protein BSKO_03736 [Bryopsis sp. KO-2023]
MLAVALLAIVSIATTQSPIQVSAEKTEPELRGNLGLPRLSPTHDSGSGNPISRKLLTEAEVRATRVVRAPAMHNFVQVIRDFTATPLRELREIREDVILPIMNQVLDGKGGICDDICRNHEMESAFMRNCFDGHSGNCCEALSRSGGWDVGGCDCGPKVSCNLLPFDADPTFQGCGLTLPMCM